MPSVLQCVNSSGCWDNDTVSQQNNWPSKRNAVIAGCKFAQSKALNFSTIIADDHTLLKET